jgi:TIR domain
MTELSADDELPTNEGGFGMAEVFINYRTGDGDEAAEHLAARLSDRFGKEHVFKASHSMPAGSDFTEELIDAARRCEVLLAIMGSRWEADPKLLDAEDWVRKEIQAANDSHRIVIPILKGRKTERLTRGSLPQDLEWLANRNSLRLDMNESTRDIDRIGDFLAEEVPALKTADRSAAEPADPGGTHNSVGDNAAHVYQARDVSGGMGNSSFGDFHGPVNFGDGPQHNLIAFLDAHLRASSRPHHQPIDDLRKLQKRFIPPPGFDAALAAIQEHGIVILAGPTGSGRTATAQMLLLGTWSGQDRARELPLDQDGNSSLHLNPDYVEPNDLAWVNLSEAGQLWDTAQRDLPALFERVKKFDARLVVIIPPQDHLHSQFRDYLQRLGRVADVEVLNHLLRAEDLLSTSDQVQLPKFLADMPSMADLRLFVDNVLDAREESGGKGDIKSWMEAASEPTAPRERRISDAVKRLCATQRALMLSTAMLHGAHADIIDRRASALRARRSDETVTILDRLPLDQRLRDIEAKTDVARRVHFLSPGYEIAVRTFFWRHFPELHEDLSAWVNVTLDSNELSDHDREGLARGFTQMCLEQRYQAHWRDLVVRLTSGRNESKMLAAAAALELGLRDEDNSRTFRRQVYEWSRGRDTSDALAEILVVACGVMADTHPAEALVRLHHLARRRRQIGAREPLINLARRDHWLLALLLSRLTRRKPETAWANDPALFLDVFDAASFTSHPPNDQPLIAQDEVTRQLASGWALAFTKLPGQQWAPRVTDWLRYAADDDANRHVLVDVLINGAQNTPALLPALYGLVHRAEWRDKIADLVLEKISAVQGVELPDGPNSDH